MAQLDKSTWMSAWPGKSRPKTDAAMLQKLKDYKAAKSGKSILALRTELETLIGLVESTEKEAEVAFKSHPLDKRSAAKALAAMKAQAETELKAAKVSTKSIVVYKRPLGLALAEAMSEDHFKASPRYVELTLLEVFADEIAARNGESMLNIACNKVFDAAVKDCARDIQAFIDENDGILGKKQIRKVDKIVDGVCKSLSDELRKVPPQVLHKIGLNERIAKDYALDKAISIGIASGSVIASATGIVVPGTQPLAIAMTVRASIALLKEIATVAASVERKISAFRAYLVILQKMFVAAEKKSTGKLSGGEKFGEWTIDTVNKLTGIDIFPTIKKAKDDFKEIEQSVTVMAVRCQKLQAEVVDALEKCAKLNKDLVAKNTSDAFRSGSLMKKLTKAEGSLDKILERTYELVKRTNEADDELPELRRQLKALGEPGATVEKIQKATGVVIHLAGAVVGLTDAAVVGGAALSSMLLATEGALLEAEATVKELM